jgi:type II secretory pathway pseudopilin PulG
MDKRGFTIIEAVVGVAILLIVAGSLFNISNLVIENIGQTRVRHTARLLANEKIEEARNLSYDDLGTQGGIPAGPIPQEQTVSLGGAEFTVKTAIVYVDDPFDGVVPEDTLSTDYKRVRIQVSWGGGFSSGKRPVVLVSDIAPKGVETSEGGGTLSILVFNAQGEPVSGAQVNITNTQVVPNINLDSSTDSFGRVLLPGSPISIAGYRIIVTKSGYSTDRTYGEEEVANPTKPHQTVLEGEVTEVSFAIDKVSTLAVASYGSRETSFPTLPNVSFRLRGEKIIGTDTQENFVYKYDQNLTTDGEGSVNLENMEFDNYIIEITDTGYDLAGSNPVLPISLLPDTSVSISLSLASDSQNSLLVFVEDDMGQPVSSASAQLINSGFGYDETILTGDPQNPDFGHAFFPSLSPLQYNLTINLTGYEEATASIQIDEDVFTKIILNPL